MNPDATSQDMLWALPNAIGPFWWWCICAVFAIPGAGTMFIYLVMNQKFGGLLIARAIIVGSLVCFSLVWLNSGWLPWGVLLASIGGAYASFLIATNWCDRQDKWRALWTALIGPRSERNDAQRPAHE